MPMQVGGGSQIQSTDLTKKVAAYAVAFPVGLSTAQVINPADDAQSIFVNNQSSATLRFTVTFKAGILGNATPATQTFLVGAGAPYSMDFGAHDGDNALGSIDAIDSVSVLAVNLGTTTVEASTLTAATLVAAGNAIVNFASA